MFAMKNQDLTSHVTTRRAYVVILIDYVVD